MNKAWDIRPGESIVLRSRTETLYGSFRGRDTIRAYFDVVNAAGEIEPRSFSLTEDGSLFKLRDPRAAYYQAGAPRPAPYYGVFPWPGHPRTTWTVERATPALARGTHV